MMKKLTAILCCLLVLTGFARPVFSETNTVGEPYALADGILAFRMEQDGTSDVQEWLDGGLTESVGAATEWWCVALRQSGGNYQFEEYAAALDAYLAENRIPGAVERMRYALTLVALGWETHPFVADALASSIGEQGIMSWLYGLHFTANGIACPFEPEAIIEKLTALQLADGGWAVSGENADVDVTAMVLQALAPYRDTDGVEEMIDAGLTLLSERQLSNGGFTSYGQENAESAAQVVLALTALGLDPETDTRFVKDASAVDALLAFRIGDGGFRHTADGEENAVATVQAYCAAVSLARLAEGRGSFFALDGESIQLPEATYVAGKTENADGTDDADHAESSVEMEKTAPISLAALGWVAAGAALVVCVICGVRRKKRGAVIFAGVAVVFFLLTLFANGGSGGASVPPEAAAGTASITIRCDTVAGQSEDLPEDGCILPETECAFAEAESVFDLLVRATREGKIPVESKNTGGLVYVSGIYSLYEFDYGGGSGWIYRVNGETPSVSCDSYPLQDGDRVEWLYTCDMGNDLD